jgi:hypothetical protein
VACEEVSAKAVLICNPNATCYELIYFHSNWLEFYLSVDVNVILWNYRGYGGSGGTPSVNNIVEDGLCVLEHFRKTKNIDCFGIHGESLGGYVAIQIAAASEPSFLLADRTFGSLLDVIYYKYGSLGYYIYKISGLPSTDCVSQYLDLNCYKMIAGDPNDKIIDELASIKAGITVRFVSKARISVRDYHVNKKWVDNEYLLSHHEHQELLEALGRVIRRKYEENTKRIHDYLEKCPQNLKTENFDFLDAKNCAEEALDILSCINAGGVYLKDIPNCTHVLFRLHLWVALLELWGSPSRKHINPDDCIVKSINRIKKILFQLKFLDKTEIAAQINTISTIFIKILEHLQKTIKKTPRSLKTEENCNEIDCSKIGYFININCGHQGQYNLTETKLYKAHLIQSRFL